MQSSTSLQGGGISYNGDGSPAWASGEAADRMTFYRRANGTRHEVFSYPYSDNKVTFNGHILPEFDGTTDLGTTSTRFNAVYADNLFGRVQEPTFTSAITINVTGVDNSTSGATLLTLDQYITDISDEYTWIDFTFRDSNANATPQVKIGAQAGDHPTASQTQEGTADFVVQCGVDSSASANTMTEMFRVSHDSKIISVHHEPQSDSNFDLGTNTVRWRNVYADTLYGDGSNLTGISSDLVNDTTPQLGGTLDVNGNVIQNGFGSNLILRLANGEKYFQGIPNGASELFYDGNKKFETTNNGAEITGRLEIDRGSAVDQAIDIKTTGTTGASRIRFLESGTLKAQVAYSHGGDQIEIVGNAGQKAAFFTNGNQRLFIDTSGNIGFNRTNTNAGDSQTQAQVSTPNRVVFNNQYSNGFTDASLKVYLFNDGSTRQGFTSGPEYDVQYHSSGHSTLTKHSFYTANTERLRINSDTNGRYLGRTPLNPAESAEEIKNDVSGTPDNDWYYIKQFGNVARLHYCVFKDKNGNDIAGGPWTMNWVAGVHPNQFSTNGSTALSQYLNLCKGIGIDKPGRGMESSRTTAQVYGAWLAVKRALWDLDPGFFEGASAASGGVLLMPLLNSNGEGGSSAHRLVYSTSTSTHIPPNQDGDHCNASQLFCGWWGGNDFTSWATDNNSVPSPEDWGPQDAPHTGNIGAKSNSTTQKPSWRDLMLVTCIYK